MDFYVGQKLTKMVKSIIITFLWITFFFSQTLKPIRYYIFMCHFFEKYEHFCNFITLQFLACKKYTMKHIFKNSKNWSKVIHSSL